MQKFSSLGLSPTLGTWVLDFLTADWQDPQHQVVADFGECWEGNHLLSNNSKTKEVLIDFYRTSTHWWTSRVWTFRWWTPWNNWVGCSPQQETQLVSNTDAMDKNGQSRLYLLKRLRSFRVRSALLRTFYHTMMASAVFCIAGWGGSRTDRDRKRLNKLLQRAGCVLGCSLNMKMVSNLYDVSCVPLVWKTVESFSHIFNQKMVSHLCEVSCRLSWGKTIENLSLMCYMKIVSCLCEET